MSSEHDRIDVNAPPSPTPEMSEDASRRRIFISYKRNIDLDESLAIQVYQALKPQHEVFIDQTMLVGTRWAERIEAELRRSNFLITLLSEHSVHSEMVLAEIETAHRLNKESADGPVILPVRLAYREPFEYPLSAYLNSINWAFWDGPDDTRRLIAEMKQAISGGELSISGSQLKRSIVQVNEPRTLPRPSHAAQPALLEMPEGTMDAESRFYVRRSPDDIALETIKRAGVTLTIKAPRQMGKSSLLIRTINEAARAGKRVAFLDFQLIDKAALADGDLFFRQFCSWLTDSLEMDDQVEEFWRVQLPNGVRCTRYLSRYLLKEVNGPLVLAMDEVDSIFEAEFRSDFFGMLRSWHNSRQLTSVWRHLDLALVTSTEPYLLIENMNQSPFNVGEVIELNDFTESQVADLNRRHGSALSPNEEQRLMSLLHGHPYLMRRALYLIASERSIAEELFAHATEDGGPFGDHLRYHLFRLHNKPELLEGLRQVLSSNTCRDELVFFRLRGAGLVRREGRRVMPRCSLYADYFREQLHV
jgi:hypothetical protein